MTEDQMHAIADAVARLSIAIGDAIPRGHLQSIRVNGVDYSVRVSAATRAIRDSESTGGLDGIAGSTDTAVTIWKTPPKIAGYQGGN